MNNSKKVNVFVIFVYFYYYVIFSNNKAKREVHWLDYFN